MLTSLTKYIPFSQSNCMGIIQLEIIDDSSQLVFSLKLFQVRKSALFSNISEALDANPNNGALAAILDKELFMEKQFTQLQSVNIQVGMQQTLTIYLQTNNSPIGTDIQINNIEGLNNFKLPYNKAVILFNFIKFFVDNYDLIKMKHETKDQVVEARSDLLKPEKVETENSDISRDTGLFAESMNCIRCPNILKVFLSKQILQREFAVSSTINNESQELTIKHLPLYNFNIWEYSPIHTHDLLLLLNTILENNLISITNKLKTLTRQVLYLLLYDKIQNNKEWEVTITCLLALIYIYSLKLVENKYISNVENGKLQSGSNYLETLNTGINYIIDKFRMNNGNKVIVVYGEEPTSVTALTDKFQGLMAKYQYLNNVDNVSFNNNVFGEFIKDSTEPNLTGDGIETALNNFNIVDINSFKTNTTKQSSTEEIFEINPTTMLSYIDVNHPMFKDKHIISFPLAQVLLIQYNATNRMYVKDSSMVRLYIDMIINHILPAMEEQRFLAENITSVFQIFEHFVKPFTHTAITDRSIQYLIFQIIMPYLYCSFNLRKIIDNFH